MGSFHVYYLAHVILGMLLYLSGLQLCILKMEIIETDSLVLKT